MTQELDFHSRGELNRSCFALNIHRAARVVAKKFDDAFRPLGVNHWQFSMLMTLNIPNGMSVNELASALVVDRTTITANVKPLERAGYLTIRVDEDDARSRRIEITPAGIEVIKEAFPIWKKLTIEIGDTVGETGREVTLGCLAEIIHAHG